MRVRRREFLETAATAVTAAGMAAFAGVRTRRAADAEIVLDLTHEDMHSTNTFEKPDEVRLTTLPVQVSGDAATVTIPRQRLWGSRCSSFKARAARRR